MASPIDIRKGKVIDYHGAPHLVLDMLHRTQGRQAGFVQTNLRNLTSGSTTNVKFRSTDSVDIMMTDTKRLEFSYLDADGYHFLDPDTFEDTLIPPEMVEEARKFLSEGNMYDVLFVEDRAVQIQLRSAVNLKIVEAPGAVRGDTASKVQKRVTTETGLVVQVPLFVTQDDTIKVSTADGTYLGRA